MYVIECGWCQIHRSNFRYLFAWAAQHFHDYWLRVSKSHWLEPWDWTTIRVSMDASETVSTCTIKKVGSLLSLRR